MPRGVGRPEEQTSTNSRSSIFFADASQALACMQKAIEIGTGVPSLELVCLMWIEYASQVDKNALTRGMVRLERKAADSKGPDVPPEGVADGFSGSEELSLGVEMDIKYIKDKSLSGEAVKDKKDNKKGKEKDKEKDKAEKEKEKEKEKEEDKEKNKETEKETDKEVL